MFINTKNILKHKSLHHRGFSTYIDLMKEKKLKRNVKKNLQTPKFVHLWVPVKLSKLRKFVMEEWLAVSSSFQITKQLTVGFKIYLFT